MEVGRAERQVEGHWMVCTVGTRRKRKEIGAAGMWKYDRMAEDPQQEGAPDGNTQMLAVCLTEKQETKAEGKT